MKLTKRTVDSLEATGKEIVVWDEDLPGFGIRLKSSGAGAWIIQYRNAHGRSRRLTIGRVGRLTPDEARKEAKQKLAAVDRGDDPAEARAGARKAITVSELCDDYLASGEGRIKASTLKMDRSRIVRHVKPLLGSRPVAGLVSADLEKFLRDIIAGKSARPITKNAAGKIVRPKGGITAGGPGVASRTLGMLGTILERAVRDGILATNPVRGIKRPKGGEVKPAFSFEKVAALGKALREEAAERGEIEPASSKTGRNAVRLLLLTGFRRMECLTLTWEMIDTSARCVRFPDTKSGKQVRPVGRAALNLLAGIEPDEMKSADYVFPGSPKPKKAKASSPGTRHLVGLPKIWERLAKRAGLKDVSIHGLRHWYASAATELGYSDIIIGALLGHAKRGITGRYATAPDPALLAAADRISIALALALDSKRDDKVVDLTGTR